MAFPGPSIGPWQLVELDIHIINEVFRQIEEQISLLRGLRSSTTVSSSGTGTATISIGQHTHESAVTGGILSHDDALTDVSANDHHDKSHSHDGSDGSGSLAAEIEFQDANETASHISDEVFGGTGVTVTELADGSGDAISIAIDTSTLVETTDADWIDLTDGGTTTLHSHSGSTAETDQALYDAVFTIERITDHIFAGSNITITEYDESGAISIASTGGGVTDHGALTGLDPDDDHTQYLLASDATNRSTFATNWIDLTDAGETTLHSHAGSSSNTDQALYDAVPTVERITDHIFAGSNITITEYDESGTISIAANTSGGAESWHPFLY